MQGYFTRKSYNTPGANCVAIIYQYQNQVGPSKVGVSGGCGNDGIPDANIPFRF